MVFSTPVHRSDYGWTRGITEDKEEDDFGKNICTKTNDYLVDETNLLFKLFAFGSFNDHCIHHMLPTIDLSKQTYYGKCFLKLVKSLMLSIRNRNSRNLLLGQ